MSEDLKELIPNYLKEARMMQLATCANNQPWNCTLYFASDREMNIYWISKADTRHSQEIAQNPKVALAIPVKFDDLTVVGLQAEGEANIVEDANEIKAKVKLYSDKFNRGEDWYQEFLESKNPHKLYRFKPTRFVIFDRVNFPDVEKQEFIL